MEVATRMTAEGPGRSSIVLRATHILRLRIQSAQAGAWTTTPDGLLQRWAQITMALVEVLKGVVDKHPGEQLQIRVPQRSSGSPRRPSAPGVWSAQPLEPGYELLAFCYSATSRAAADLLAEGPCEQILPAEGNLDDVQLALRAEAEKLSPAAILDLAVRQASLLGYVFTEYLLAKLTEPALRELRTFEALMGLLETPELTLIARWSLLKEVYAAIIHSPQLSPEHVHRLTISFFRLLEVSPEASVRDNIVQVFLPNLLGIQGGLSKRYPDDVFAGAAPERGRVEAILRRYQGSASTQALLTWLSTPRP
jgi:hypothetical protein